MRSKILASAVGLLSLFAALPAQAEASPTAGHASAAALLGNGFKDGVGIGLGVRGGYTLPMNVYVGGTFIYHLGKSEATPFGDIKVNIYYFGGEVGYDIAAGPAVVRPYLGLGPATAIGTIPAINLGGATIPSQSTSDTKFGFWPGVTGLYPIGS